MLAPRQRRVVAAPLPKKRRKRDATTEEIPFDFDARQDYLTGFHKRKLQRIKLAKEQAVKKEKEAKLSARKALREERKSDLEKHVAEISALLDHAVDSDSEERDTNIHDVDDTKVAEVLDEEAEYMDEDRQTTVTIEAVDVTRDGLQKAVVAGNGSGDDEEPATGRGGGEGGGRERSRKASGETTKRTWTKERPNGIKKKKPKFRYESKAERKVTRFKERSGNKAKAKARGEEVEQRLMGGKEQAQARKKKRMK